jgi:hypothetical protein
MSHNLDKYLPEFDEDGLRSGLTAHNVEVLVDMLVDAYKEKRVLAKLLDEEYARLRSIEKIIAEPSSLTKMPGIPTAEDIRRMFEEN